MNTITLTPVHEAPFDCDCCGTCYPEGLRVEYNNSLIWERYSDGHMSGHQTPESLLDAVLAKWSGDLLAALEVDREREATEAKRHEWNDNHPGNAIARTPESWQAYHASHGNEIPKTVQYIRSMCTHLPHSEVLQVKMIALWIEDCADKKIVVKVND